MKDFRKKAKVLLFDLEVSPTLGWGYGQYETHIIKVEQAPILLSVSWKWLGEKGEPECLTVLDTSVDPFNDEALVKKLWSLLDEAEVIVAHNVNGFDKKMANAFFLRHGLTPPCWYKAFDTLQVARRNFKLDNNKLDYLGKLLCGEGKTETTYADCWYDMFYGTPKQKKRANALMKDYNKNDVVLLEKIYYKLLPYADTHPNMALAAGVDYICPRCGFEADFRVKAYRRTGTQVNAIQYQCQHCGGYVTRPLSKEEREELAEKGSLKSVFRNTN